MALTHQQFSEVILMFITKETDSILLKQMPDLVIKNCPKCADLLDSFTIKPVIIALRISCRALTF
jgi:hypothetical protein